MRARTLGAEIGYGLATDVIALGSVVYTNDTMSLADRSGVIFAIQQTPHHTIHAISVLKNLFNGRDARGHSRPNEFALRRERPFHMGLLPHARKRIAAHLRSLA